MQSSQEKLLEERVSDKTKKKTRIEINTIETVHSIGHFMHIIIVKKKSFIY